MCELLATLEGVTYLERVAVNNPKNIIRAKKAIKKAFQNQVDGKGYSFVEVISHCPVDWGMEPVDAIKWVENEFLKTFPLGVYKDK
jgi:2-oxoglutarate ferredoxin oxidoreductase subunit beta